VAAPAAGLTPAMARKAQANALEMAFLPAEEKQRLQEGKKKVRSRL
jgi:adenosine deaminase